MTSAGNSPDGHPTAKSVNVAPFTLAKGGVSMGDKTLSFAENVFGRRFDDVRIHNDDEGHAIASGKGARAVTVGKHIYFAKGQYSPENAPGKALLAHELTHIAQTGGGTVTKPEVARPGGSLAGARDAEAQAEEVERAVFSGRPAPAIGQLTPGPVELRKVIGGHSESEVTKFARQHGESMDLYAPGTKSVDKSVRTQVAPDGPPAEILARYEVVGYSEVAYGVVIKSWGAESGPDGCYTTTTTMSEAGGSGYDVIRVWALAKRRSTAIKSDPSGLLIGLGGALGLALMAGAALPGKKRPLSDTVATAGQSAPAGSAPAPSPAQDAAAAKGAKIFASSKIDKAAWGKQMGVGGRLQKLLSGDGPSVSLKSKAAKLFAQQQAQPVQPAAVKAVPAPAKPLAAPAQAQPEVLVNKGPQFQKVSESVAAKPAPAAVSKPAVKSVAPASKPAASGVKTGVTSKIAPPKPTEIKTIGAKPATKPVIKPLAKPSAPKTVGVKATAKPVKSPATSNLGLKKTPPLAKKSPAPPKKRPELPKRPAPSKKSPAPPKKSPAPPKKSPAPPKKSPAPPKKSPAPPKKSPAPPKKTPPLKTRPALKKVTGKATGLKAPAPKGLKQPLVKAGKGAKSAAVTTDRPQQALATRPLRLKKVPAPKTENMVKAFRENAKAAGVEPTGGSNRPILPRFLPQPVVKAKRLRPFFMPRIVKGPRKARAKSHKPLLLNEARKSVRQGRRGMRTVSQIFNDMLTHKISRAMAGDDVPEAAPLPDYALDLHPGATGGVGSVNPAQGGAAGGVAGPKTGAFMGGLLGALKAGLTFASKRFSSNGFGAFASDMLGTISAGEGMSDAIEQAVGAFKGGGLKGLMPKLGGIGEAANRLSGASKPVLSAFGFSLSPQAGGVQIGAPSLENAAESNERTVLRMLSRNQAGVKGQGATGGQAPSGTVQPDARAGGVRGPALTPASGGGETLSGPAKQYVENFFGRSFSGVRIHRDSSSVAAADSLNAHAFTSGSDIYFGRGEFRPDTPKGMSLLVHELTHVTQQGGGVSRKATQGGEGETAWGRMAVSMEALADPLFARLGDEAAAAGITSKGALMRALMPKRPAGVVKGDVDPNVGGGKVDVVSKELKGLPLEHQLAAHATALPGMPLPADMRARLEEEIDVDLSRVRLFSGGAAKEAAAGMGAEAFAKGESIVLGEKAAADIASGKSGTLAHELEHVRQHQRGETRGSTSPLAREVLEDTAREVERRMPTFSKAMGLSDFLMSDRMVERVSDGLPQELELLRQPKRPQPFIQPEARAEDEDDDQELPDDGSNAIHQLMWYYGVRPQVGEEEFLDELKERVQDLMEEELKIERERKHIEAPY